MCSGDQIVEITSIGEQDVHDGTVSGTHNFVANAITLRNSLEQDADMVILLHRPDAFERDDPQGGEADPHRGQAPQRPDEDDHSGASAASVAVHEYGALISAAGQLRRSELSGDRRAWA